MEQYYQSSKADEFGDKDIVFRIMCATDPKEMYALGQQVKGFDEDIWLPKCKDIMMTGLLAKFQSTDTFKKAMLNTKDDIFVECNGKDEYWGAGVYMSDPRSNDRSAFPGENHLGRLLMRVRSVLREGV